MSVVYVNGQFLAAEQAKISVFDRSYLFGEGLFETLRSYGGKLPFLTDHLNRLEWSATFLNLPYPAGVDFAAVIQKLLSANLLEDARIKIVLSRGEQNHVAALPTQSALKEQGHLVIFCEPLSSDKTPPLYRLKVVKNFVNDALPLASMKLTHYLVKTLARQEAVEAGFHDAVLLNHKGMVTEASTGNLFWLDKDGYLKTVRTSEGLLGGIMKKRLLDLLVEKGIRYREDSMTPEELSHAREIFLTNSLVGIKPVVAIDHRQISGGEIGPVTQQILELWNKKLQEILS